MKQTIKLRCGDSKPATPEDQQVWDKAVESGAINSFAKGYRIIDTQRYQIKYVLNDDNHIK